MSFKNQFKRLSFFGEIEPEEFEQFEEEGLTPNPKDYYFAFSPDGDDDEDWWVIAPKKIWDTQRLWSDSGYIGSLLADALEPYFFEEMEAHFSTELSRADAKAALEHAGLTYNQALVDAA